MGAADERWLLPDSVRRLSEARRRYITALPDQMHWPCKFIAWHRLHDPECDALLELGEQRAAEAGIELRMPLWSAPMLQFSISVPQRLLYSPGLDRPLHRCAMRGRLPEQVLARADKAEFSSVFRAIMPDVVQWLSSNIPDCEGLDLNRSLVTRMLQNSSINPMGDELWQLWLLFGVTAAQIDTIC
jgi:Asparagine synthase.